MWVHCGQREGEGGGVNTGKVTADYKANTNRLQLIQDHHIRTDPTSNRKWRKHNREELLTHLTHLRLFPLSMVLNSFRSHLQEQAIPM